MKIKIIRDAHFRVSSGISQHFKASAKPINVPKATAEALVERGDAELIGTKPSSGKGD